MSDHNFSIDSEGSITPTSIVDAHDGDNINFTTTNNYTVYIYDDSGVLTDTLFESQQSSIAYNQWPQTIKATTGVFTLSTCTGGTSCSKQSGGTRGNGTVRVNNGGCNPAS